MTRGFFSGDLFRGLAFRVLFFLSLALLPIGLIAVVQTQQIIKQTQTTAELSLLAVTEQVTSARTDILRKAFSAAEALGPVVKLLHNDVDECSEFLTAYKEASVIYVLVGFIDENGIMACSSSEAPVDFSQDSNWIEMVKSPARQANSISTGAVTQRPVAVVSVPVFKSREFAGAVVISIPYDAFEGNETPNVLLTPLAIMTFNNKGEILTTDRALDISETEMPADVALSLFAGDEPIVFQNRNQNGIERAYAVQPIIANTAYAMSVWPTNTPFLQRDLSARAAALLPVIMWAASLIVAFWALNRLAIRHIRKLGRQMRRFALNRTLPQATLGQAVPSELIDMETAFLDMGESILRDEAILEDGLRQKNILLKEVHHRVKNNLQLISSIMNMQIRQATSSDAKFVLRRLQDRILSLATVHKSLYQNDNLEQVEAGALLHETVNQLLAVGLPPGSNVKITQDYADVLLNADDAAPLTLLVSEAMTNALKYLPKGSTANKELTVRLVSMSPELARFSIANTIGGAPDEAGTGLGSRLIEAFARQLNGQVEVAEEDTVFTLTITFPVPQSPKQSYDY